MRSFHVTVFGLLFLFLTVMGVVATVAFYRPSNKTGIDPAQISELRHQKSQKDFKVSCLFF